MKYIIAILIFFLGGLKTYADYEPTSLPELIIESDLIIHGIIESQDSSTFTLKVSDCIKGDLKSNIIRVQKFENWTCAKRIVDYKKGQEEIVFIKGSFEKNCFYTMGAGNEGELLIANDTIVYPDIYWDSKSGCKEICQLGVKICGWKFSLTDFKDSIRFYLKEFRLLKIEYKSKNKISNRLKENRVYARIIYESYNYFLFSNYLKT